jgi:hypothetical protein
MEQVHTDRETLIHEDIIVHSVEELTRKSCVGQDKRKETSREVPNFGNNNRRRTH